MEHPLFSKRRALLVTRHGKDKVIGPVLAEGLGIELIVTDAIDTDEFGTFSGERERPDTQYNTARLKALQGLKEFPAFDLAIASEGSFSPHPDSPFLPVNREIVILLDRKNDLEIAGSHTALAAGVKEARVGSPAEAREFAAIAGFPKNGIVLKTWRVDNREPILIKDFLSWADLEIALANSFSMAAGGSITVQTDMRAHRNPQRMENIRLATLDLVKNILRACPRCQSPGFAVTETRPGLPCGHCGLPTRTALAWVYACQKCHYREERDFPEGRKEEDPGRCDYCNP